MESEATCGTPPGRALAQATHRSHRPRRPHRSERRCGTPPGRALAQAKPDPISLDISPANGGMSDNQGGWDEGEAPEGQTRWQRTDARSDHGRLAGALERTAE